MKFQEPMTAYAIALTQNPASLLGFLSDFKEDQKYLKSLKSLAATTDDRIAYWLNMNVKTFRNHRDKDVALKADTREHLVLLVSFLVRGVNVFGDSAPFGQWLEAENFHLDGQKPADLLNTNSGIRLLDDRLTGMEHGDNA